MLWFPSLALAQGANAEAAPGSPTADNLPIYELDPTWPPTLPNDWIWGDIRGLFADDEDHLWVIHMPSSLTPQEIGAATSPPIADCCKPAPPVLELDTEGKVLRAWGGPGPGYTWFDQEHGIYIDHGGSVWMGTSNGKHVMKFTQDGKHLLTIGEPGVNKGSNDPDHLGGPANFYVEPTTNELFIADGYINKRVVVYDAASGKYKRHWGAYGKRPVDTEKYEYPVKLATPPQQYSTLHGLVGTKDGLIYVSDRRGNRIQVFRQNGEYLMERFVRPETGGSGSGFSLQVSRDPGQTLLYLIDGTNQRVWILRRKDLAILDRFGRPGRQAGEFIRAHMIAIDSQNRMYTGEAGNGRRIQRWILKGTRPAATVKPPSP
jgi:DNA-binding beta-propeller fold protein YncE